jgi:hypothetical protein
MRETGVLDPALQHVYAARPARARPSTIRENAGNAVRNGSFHEGFGIGQCDDALVAAVADEK